MLSAPRTFSLEMSSGSSVAYQHAVMQDARNLPLPMRVTVLLPALPLVDGRDAGSVGEASLEQVLIEGDGVELRVQRSVSVRVGADSVIVVVGR